MADTLLPVRLDLQCKTLMQFTLETISTMGEIVILFLLQFTLSL